MSDVRELDWPQVPLRSERAWLGAPWILPKGYRGRSGVHLAIPGRMMTSTACGLGGWYPQRRLADDWNDATCPRCILAYSVASMLVRLVRVTLDIGAEAAGGGQLLGSRWEAA